MVDKLDMSQEGDTSRPTRHVSRYGSQARNMVMSVYRYFSRQWGGESVAEVMEKTSQATEVPRETIKKIKRQASKLGPDESFSSPVGPHKRIRIMRKLDSFEKECIRKEILAFYERGELPTLDELLRRVKEEPIKFEGGRTTLWTAVREMGFRYKKVTSGRAILMEREDIVVARTEYLRLVERNRECSPSKRRSEVFLDETWMNQNECVGQCWTDAEGRVGPKLKTGKGSRFIILHAGNDQGFIKDGLLIFKSKNGNKGDYHDSMDHAKFKKWFEEQLLPNIRENSLIIMDNAPYHSKIENKMPSSSNTKSEIINWLCSNNITHDPSSTKPKLLQIAKQHKDKQKYVIDEIARANGHDILRLPPYYCQFNPIELIWAQVKRHVRTHNSNCDHSMKNVERLTREAIENITAEDWRKCIQHVKKIEEDFRNKDLAREHLFENFVINIDDEDSDEDDFQ